MRHAGSPRTPPTADTAKTDNKALERQLDAAGEAGSTAMDDALRALKIPIGEVLSSPMQGVTEAQADWLRARAAQPPLAWNTLIVTHQPNLA